MERRQETALGGWTASRPGRPTEQLRLEAAVVGPVMRDPGLPCVHPSLLHAAYASQQKPFRGAVVSSCLLLHHLTALSHMQHCAGASGMR